MTGKQSLVGLLTLGLVVANLWAGPQRKELTQLASGDLSGVKQLKVTGAELLGAVVVTYIAGVSDGAANIVLVFTVGLWLLWVMNNSKHLPFSFTGFQPGSTASPATAGKPTGQTLA